jgi:hypothetical protein
MSNEAFDWLVLLVGWFVVLGVGAFVGMVWESWAEWRRERRTNRRLPNPNCRARVTRRWNVPE